MKTVVSVVLIAFFMVTATAQEKQRRARSDFISRTDGGNTDQKNGIVFRPQ